MVDHEKNRVSSIFEDATLNRVERDLENILQDEHVQKQFNTERFQLELDRDRNGNKINQTIQSFVADKYKVVTIYTMTKFKLNTKKIDPFGIQASTFDEYLKANRQNITSLGVEKPVKRYFDIDTSQG